MGVYVCCRGIENIHDGIGHKECLLIEYITTFLGGVILAFLISWKLALAIMTMLPLIVILGAMDVKVRLCTCSLSYNYTVILYSGYFSLNICRKHKFCIEEFICRSYYHARMKM